MSQNHAIAIQPLDANVQGRAYIHMPCPYILGNSVTGIVEEVGSSVTRFKKGDRVASDTPVYQLKESKYGAWQKYVVSKEATTAKIAAGTGFEDAAAIPFALLTAVAALQLKLGMGKPHTHSGGKALIWGAGGSVGGYAVQYASSVSEPRVCIHLLLVLSNTVLYILRLATRLWRPLPRANSNMCVVSVRPKSSTTRMTRSSPS